MTSIISSTTTTHYNNTEHQQTKLSNTGSQQANPATQNLSKPTAMAKPLTKVTSKEVPVPFVDWGIAKKASMRNTLGVLSLIVGCPTLVILNWIALEQYGGSLTGALRAAVAQGPVRFFLQNFPRPSLATFAGYVAWLLLQALLYGILPGAKAYGQRTPGGMKQTTLSPSVATC